MSCVYILVSIVAYFCTNFFSTRGLSTSFTIPTHGRPATAIAQLTAGIRNGDGSRPCCGGYRTGQKNLYRGQPGTGGTKTDTLVLSHNKTPAAQLYGEFKQFFPHNAVEYFVSYYDYYQPEAYVPSSGVYIEKELSINEEIENCASAPPLRCFRAGGTCWWFRPCRAFTVWATAETSHANIITVKKA